MTRLWCRLGWQDVRHRYRRSMLGPWWITVGTGVMIVLLGALYGGLFRQRTVDHLPYVAAGLVVWGLIASRRRGLRACRRWVASSRPGRGSGTGGVPVAA